MARQEDDGDALSVRWASRRNPKTGVETKYGPPEKGGGSRETPKVPGTPKEFPQVGRGGTRVPADTVTEGDRFDGRPLLIRPDTRTPSLLKNERMAARKPSRNNSRGSGRGGSRS